MRAIDFLKEIETNYDVRSIKVRNMEVWPFLRMSYSFAYIDRHDFNIKEQRKTSLWTKITRLKNVFYGFRNLFKKYDYLIFSGIREIRFMNGKYVNKLAEFLITELGKKKALLIENPAGGSHPRRSKSATENMISLDFFLVFRYVPFLKRRFIIENEMILKKINRKYNLKFNYRMVISKFISYANIFTLFFRVFRPRLVFVSEYYSPIYQAAISTAKKSCIKTIELQHSVINEKHPAYNFFVKLDKSFFPDYLFAFGDYVKNVFDENNYFMKKDNVLPVGSMYIDHIKNEYKASEGTINMFSSFRKKYRKIVAVSSQWTIENKLIDFLKRSASLNRNVLYIFVPRDVSKDYSNANFPENIRILKNLNVYQIVKEANFHATVYSTCALEAPALGVPNILINIDDMAEKYYSDLLVDRDVTIFVETEEEFVDVILNWHTRTSKEIMDLHEDFYKQNHKESLKQALEIIETRSYEKR